MCARLLGRERGAWRALGHAMSNGINYVILQGNLGADPELLQTATGEVLKLRLATTESYYDKEDKLQQDTQWHRITMFGKRAKGLARILHKGSHITVQGKNQSSSYEKNGEKRYGYEVIARDITLGGGAPRQAARDPELDQLPPLSRMPAPAASVSLSDLPF